MNDEKTTAVTMEVIDWIYFWLSAGSAIGLGAMWKIPYIRAGFMAAVFWLCLISPFVGLPLLIMEFTVGKMERHATQIYSKINW